MGLQPGPANVMRIVQTLACERHYHKNGNGRWNKDFDVVSQFGSPGDLPIIGDWDGDGDDDIGIYRPGTTTFILDFDGSGSWNKGSDVVSQFGSPGDLPVSGDWNGDGDDNIGIYRPGTNTFILDFDESNSWTIGSDLVNQFGAPGVPVTGKW